MKKLLAVIFLLVSLCMMSYAEEGTFIYDSHGMRDPFVPLLGIATKKRTIESLEDIASIEDVNLQGLAYDSAGKRTAIINGEMIREGETVGHLTIKKILEDEVILTINTDEYKLNINE